MRTSSNPWCGSQTEINKCRLVFTRKVRSVHRVLPSVAVFATTFPEVKYCTDTARRNEMCCATSIPLGRLPGPATLFQFFDLLPLSFEVSTDVSAENSIGVSTNFHEIFMEVNLWKQTYFHSNVHGSRQR